MKVLLLQLSDIHARSADDPVLTRASRIVDAVKSIELNIDLCIAAVTGDIAFSGAEDQYIICLDFFKELKEGLTDSLQHGAGKPVPIYFAMTPGNHDCDFSGSTTVRTSVLEGTQQNEQSYLNDEDIIRQLAAPQEQFFLFRESLAVEGLATAPGKRAYYEYLFPADDPKVAVLCVNTALTSTIRENQGQLKFPTDLIPSTKRPEELTVSLLHHPYSWLESNNAREMRNRIDAISDIVLTGHEHQASKTFHESSTGEVNTYTEGGALKYHGDDPESYFNAFVVDTEARRQKFAVYSWDGERYALDHRSNLTSDGASLEWHEFRVNRARRPDSFVMSDAFTAFLDDPGINLGIPGRPEIKLADIFVWPDLQASDDFTTGNPEIVRGNEIGDLIQSQSRLMILGEDESGKSSLAKTITANLRASGYVPVLVSPNRPQNPRPPTDDRIQGFVEGVFRQDYSSGALENYRQLGREAKAIVVDDFHLFDLTTLKKLEFVTNLTKMAAKVVLLSNPVFGRIEDLFLSQGVGPGTGNFKSYHILPFRRVKRDELIGRFVQLAETDDPGTKSFVQRLSRFQSMLDELIGRDFLPPFPLYILAIIQGSYSLGLTSGAPGTRGYYYELLIRAALAREGDAQQFDIYLGYLSYVAYHMFKQNQDCLSAVEYRTVHRKYEEQFALNLDFSSYASRLVARNIFKKTEDTYEFKYKYLYYYFVSFYLASHLEYPEIRDDIATLSSAMYLEDNANILLFLAHQSKDSVVVNEMLRAGAERFPDVAPTDLDKDVEFLRDFGASGTEKLEYTDRGDGASRQEALEAMDAAEADAKRSDKELEPRLRDPEDPLAQFQMALRAEQILGQVVKNFPGTLVGERKLQIVQSCVEIGMRALGFYLNIVREDPDQILSMLGEIIRQRQLSDARQPQLAKNEIEAAAADLVVKLCYTTAHAIVKITSKAIGASELKETYDALAESSPTAAVKLVCMALRLDNLSSDFPITEITRLNSEFRRLPLALAILRRLVLQHLYLFPTPIATKQSACARLGINYRQVQQAGIQYRLTGHVSRDR